MGFVDNYHYPSLGGSCTRAGGAPVLAPTLANSCPSAIVAAPGVVDAGGRQSRRTIAGDAAIVQLPEVTTTYLSVESESWGPPAPPWFWAWSKRSGETCRSA